jgi:hypothetical protein
LLRIMSYGWGDFASAISFSFIFISLKPFLVFMSSPKLAQIV